MLLEEKMESWIEVQLEFGTDVDWKCRHEVERHGCCTELSEVVVHRHTLPLAILAHPNLPNLINDYMWLGSKVWSEGFE